MGGGGVGMSLLAQWQKKIKRVNTVIGIKF